MKSKHCTYGKKAVRSNFCYYHFDDNFFHKSKIAATVHVAAIEK